MYEFVDSDGNILGDEDDEDFDYESGNSDYGDEPDKLYVEDLKEFCRQHSKLQLLRFPELDVNVLGDLRNVSRCLY